MKTSTGTADCTERPAEMISPSPEHLRQHADYEHTTDVRNPHAAIRRDEREVRVTIKPFSLRTLVVCGMAIFIASFCWSRYVTNSNNASMNRGSSEQSDQ